MLPMDKRMLIRSGSDRARMGRHNPRPCEKIRIPPNPLQSVAASLAGLLFTHTQARQESGRTHFPQEVAMGLVRWSMLVPLFLCVGFVQGSGKKDLPANQAEVRFGDGSLVRMTILQEHLEVQTKYGKLKVPVKDIRRIEFGLHLPEGVGPQIQAAIQLMGSNVYKQREGAVRDLVDLGHLAYPAVQKAAASADLEVAQRAASVLKQINLKVAPESLRLASDDTIQTVEFHILGRLVTPTIKAYSVHFGELSLKLSDLRVMSLRGGQDDTDLIVDAAKHGSQPNQWLDTGIGVAPNLKLTIRTDGQVDLWPQGPGQYLTGPKG